MLSDGIHSLGVGRNKWSAELLHPHRLYVLVTGVLGECRGGQWTTKDSSKLSGSTSASSNHPCIVFQVAMAVPPCRIFNTCMTFPPCVFNTGVAAPSQGLQFVFVLNFTFYMPYAKKQNKTKMSKKKKKNTPNLFSVPLGLLDEGSHAMKILH